MTVIDREKPSLSRHWDDESAEYIYRFKVWYGNKHHQYETPHHGNILWARRIAKHYKIKIPTGKKDAD